VNDRDILADIQSMVAEEHRLLDKGEAGSGLAPEDRKRLEDIQVHLDQCWDLLRQRRARREFGEDPDQARVRDASTVERYQQ
jgi:hypothetical protein